MGDAQVPAGWYDDPAGTSQLRYWDGMRWTENLRPRDTGTAAISASATAGSANADAPPAKRRGPVVALVVSLVAVAAVVVGVAVAWGPVSAALFPKYVLSDAEFYAMGEENLRADAESLAVTDPLAYPEGGLRSAPGYRMAAQQYAEDYIDDYDASERVFDSKAEADEYAYDGPYGEFSQLGIALAADGAGTPLATQSFPQIPDVVALEQQIASTPVVPGADGTYWETVDRIGEIVGSTVTRDESLNGCLDTGVDIVEPAAYFCPAPQNWDLVFFTPVGSEHPERSSLVDVMKHELSHKLIAVQCSAVLHTDRATWHDEYGEGVTNSYAVMYLGADPANLYASEDYVMDARTEAKARAIHDGDLACYDDGAAPTP